jgi:hypothetical protein
MSLSSQAQVILQEAGYRTWLEPLDQSTAICFEDDSALGFVFIFEDVRSLLEKWQSIESALLVKHADFLRRAGEKAWNVYSVFLTDGIGDDVQQRQVRYIEENLERTRKITGCGLQAHEHVVLALLPILPIQYKPILDRENAEERLRKRVEQIAPAATEAVMDGEVAATEVVPLLREKS